ncbi:uncharacterized protein LOC133893017 [Phragmites australis]|uniref:uncharacterized protein LOC133893017 n=1 Tax=Phragmites australis TaxID=29695 RepID=UPI002D7A14AC|nr:uncharacterized protein LOC133893017 [Phragmites australis]
MMRDLSCFGETSVQIADAASSSSSSSSAVAGGGGGRGQGGAAAQSLVTCLYQARLSGRPCVVSVTWSRGGLVGQAGLGVAVDDGASGERLCRTNVKPCLFSKRKGSKSLDVAGSGDGKVYVYWDLSGAKFGPGPEPLEGFYVAVVCDLEMLLLLGDMGKEAYRKTGAGRPGNDTLLVARREHIVGKKVYSAKAQFCDNGRCHDIAIECDTTGQKDPCLEIRIDTRPVMRVKRLAWKFRGNQTILVDGLPVEVFWDVHGWLFSSTTSSAVFMFQTCQALEKSMSWMYSQIFREPQLQGHGFSLLLHAWKVE